MKKFLIAAMSMLVCAAASAQQPLSKPDPAVTVCRQILDEANGRVLAMGGAAETLGAKVKELEAELSKLKGEKAGTPKTGAPVDK